MTDRSDETKPKEAPALAPVSLTMPSKGKKAGVLVTVLFFIWAFWMGWSRLKDQPSKSEAASESWQDKTIAPRVAVLRQQLAAIEARRIETVDDYIANTLETEPIIEEGKVLTRKQLIMIAKFKQDYQSNAGDLRAADYARKLTEKDEQLMYLLADEIQYAKDLQALPSAKRIAYYKAYIPSVKDKEAQLVRDWVAIANDAKANGVPLPATQSAAQSDTRQQH